MGRARFVAPVGVAYNGARGVWDERSTLPQLTSMRQKSGHCRQLSFAKTPAPRCARSAHHGACRGQGPPAQRPRPQGWLAMVVKNTDLGRGHIRTLCWPAVRRLRVSFESRSSSLASTTAFLHRPQKGVSGGPPCQPTCYRYLREKCSPDRNHAATTQRALGIDGIVPRFEPANDPEQSLRRRLVRADSVSINGAALAGERTGQGGVVRRAMPCKGPWHSWHSWQSWQCRICKLSYRF